MRLVRGLIGCLLCLLLVFALGLLFLYYFASRGSTFDRQTVAKLKAPITQQQAEKILAVTQPLLGQPAETPRPKVVILGMDGLDAQYLEPLLKEGRLPNFKRMMTEGVFTTLLSIVPPNSAAAWPAMTTGCNPGKTNLLHFRRYDPFLRRIVLTDARYLRRPALWDILGLYDMRSVVINEPVSFPPHQIRGGDDLGTSDTREQGDLYLS